MGNEKGQAAVELAVILPLLLLIALGCLDLGRAIAVWITLANGAREGARYASLYPKQNAQIISEAMTDILAEGLDVSKLHVDVTSLTANRLGGEPITVTTRYTFTLVSTQLFGTHSLPIRASTQMVIVAGGT
jgi:Flp pilus assembly protein TadG